MMVVNTERKNMIKIFKQYSCIIVAIAIILTVLTGCQTTNEKKTDTTGLHQINKYDHDAPKLHPSGIIPEGATYTVCSTGTVLEAGDEFPNSTETGDVYVYEDYQYHYNALYEWVSEIKKNDWCPNNSLNGWNVRVLDKTKSEYSVILESINNEPITSLNCTFIGCDSLRNVRGLAIPENVTDMSHVFSNCRALYDISGLIIPEKVTDISAAFYGCPLLEDISELVIPDSLIDMDSTFHGCKSLTDVSELKIPYSVRNMNGTFSDCISLTKAPKIPSNVKDMGQTFYGCYSLTGSITIDAHPAPYYGCLEETQITEILGDCPIKDKLLATK